MTLNPEQYSTPADSIEEKLDEADRQVASTTERLSHQAVFANARKTTCAKEIQQHQLLSFPG